MNQKWLLVVIAASIEVGWVTGLKHAEGVLSWGLTVVAIIVSFTMLIYSAGKLPTSTVYAVYVGLGTAGTVMAEMVFFNVPFTWAKVILIGFLLAGVVGLKMVTRDNSHEGGASS